MKYVMSWRKKRHGTMADYAAGQRRLLDLMRGWRRPDGVRLHQVLVRAGDTGGYAVVETDDVAAVRLAAAAFAPFNFHVEPVIDIDVALAAGSARRDAPA